MTKKMRVLAVSSNTGAFGHSQHVFCDADGHIWLVERIRSSHPGEWNAGDWVDVPLSGDTPQFTQLGAEFVTTAATIRGEQLAEAISEDYLQIIHDKAAARRAVLDADEATEEEMAVIRELGHGQLHGQEEGRPEYYRCPLKSRAAIVDFLLSEKCWSRRRYAAHTFLFCFNVKLNAINLSYEQLLMAYRRELPKDPAYLAACRRRHRQLYEDDNSMLFNGAIEDACRDVIEEYRDDTTGRWHGRVTDSYSTLWNGLKLNVELGFHGRSGGWLVIEKFEGLDLDRYLHLSDEDEIDYRTLRLLYEYVVMLSHDFNHENCCKAVEYSAAYNFFENVCDDIPLTRNMIGDGI